MSAAKWYLDVQDGDVLLRCCDTPESHMLANISGGVYSHAGICGESSSETAVDAYPGRDPNAVSMLAMGSFFGTDFHAFAGAIYRYKCGDGTEGMDAARFAVEQSGDHSYEFSLFDPIVGEDGIIYDDTLYCSEFVWRCYRLGANVTLIPVQDFLNLNDPDVVGRASRGLAAHAAEVSRLAKCLSYVSYVPGVPKVAVRALLGSYGHNGIFVSPHQLSVCKFLEKVCDFGLGDSDA